MYNMVSYATPSNYIKNKLQLSMDEEWADCKYQHNWELLYNHFSFSDQYI